MLERIRDVMATPQVKRLLKVLQGEMTRDELQIKLGLKDRKIISRTLFATSSKAALD